MLHIVAYGLIFVGCFVAAFLVVTKPRRSRTVAAGVACVVLVVIGISLVLLPAARYGPVIGAHAGTVWLAADDDQGTPESAVIVASPGDAFAMTISFENDAPLPMTILGLIVSDDVPRTFPAWQSSTLSTNGMPPLPGLYEGAPTGSVEIPPGGILVVNAAGVASACASGSLHGERMQSTSTIRVAYSVLGLVSATDVILPNDIVEPQNADCPVV